MPVHMFASGIDASASKGSKARIIVAQIVCENVSTKAVFTNNVVIYWYLIILNLGTSLVFTLSMQVLPSRRRARVLPVV
jgi:hypothetical protein